MKKLSNLIFHKIVDKTWKPVQLFYGGLGILYLFFADNNLFFIKAKNSQISLISNILSNFCKESGLKVNFEKSRIMYSKSICRTRKSIFSQLSIICFVSDLGQYWGFLLIKRRVKNDHFNFVWEKISKSFSF
jgi:hypothetical protein